MIVAPRGAARKWPPPLLMAAAGRNDSFMLGYILENEPMPRKFDARPGDKDFTFPVYVALVPRSLEPDGAIRGGMTKFLAKGHGKDSSRPSRSRPGLSRAAGQGAAARLRLGARTARQDPAAQDQHTWKLNKETHTDG
jgi:hypothetical protein